MNSKKIFKISTLICVMMLAFAFICIKPATANAAKVGKIKTVKVISTAKATDKKATITVSWSKAKNAKKYIVYRATAKNGKYKKIKTVSKTTFKDKKKTGLFYYKVRPINGKKKGKFSAKKGTYTVSGKFTVAFRTSTMFSSFVMHHIQINNLGKKDLYALRGENVSKIILTEKGKKKIATTISGRILGNDEETTPYKISKDDPDVGMRTATYSIDGRDWYSMFIMSNDKKAKNKFIVWTNLSTGETYVEEGNSYDKSVLFTEK